MLEKLPEALGHALRDTRAGLDGTALERVPLRAGRGTIELRSLAFVDHGPIPALYTADGDGRSPPLQWTGVPAGAASLVLIVEDADAPTPRPLVHAIAVGLAPQDGSLAEGALDRDARTGVDAVVGRNSYLLTGWLPPDPPPGHGVHRYRFQLFALNADPAWSGAPGRDAVLDVLLAHAIAAGALIGTYERADGSVREGGATPVAPSTDPPAA